MKFSTSISVNCFKNLQNVFTSPFIYCIFGEYIIELAIFYNRLCTVCEDDSASIPSGCVSVNFIFLTNFSHFILSHKQI